jgi:DNA-binding CsgD family transcriptional regulator/predicted enzyme related to lactoylglutathione lyase
MPASGREIGGRGVYPLRMTQKRPRGRPPHPDLLTPAEWRIAHAVQHGLTNRQVAALKGISLDAVKYHVGNVLGKLRLPDREALRQWYQAPLGSALSGRPPTHTGDTMTAAPLSLGPISQIARTVRDIHLSARWYTQVLGLKHLFTYDTLAFFDCGATRLMLAQKAETASESVLYFQVTDIVQAHQELVARGADFVSAPHLIHTHGDGTEEWMAFFKDPDGQVLAVHSQVAPRTEGGIR